MLIVKLSEIQFQVNFIGFLCLPLKWNCVWSFETNFNLTCFSGMFSSKAQISLQNSKTFGANLG